VFDYVVASTDLPTASLGGHRPAAHGAYRQRCRRNTADLSNVTAAFNALAINESSVPAYTSNGITRPALELDATGHIILDAAASNFVSAYGIKASISACRHRTLILRSPIPHARTSIWSELRRSREVIPLSGKTRDASSPHAACWL